MRRLNLTLLVSTLFFSPALMSQGLDQSSEKALEQTKDLLKDPHQRKKALQETPGAQSAGQTVDAITTDPQAQQQIYELAAEVMDQITRESGGDSEKMMKLMQQYQANPNALAKKLTPQQQQKVKNLSEQVSPAKPVR